MESFKRIENLCFGRKEFNKVLRLTVSLLALLSVGSAIVFAASTANPNASAKAKAVLDYFYGLPSRSDKRVVSGQFLYSDLSGVTEIFNETGHWLGMVGADYHGWNVAGPASLSDITTKVNPMLINYGNNGGLITIHWHASNPQTGAGCNDTTCNLADVINSGTATGSKWMTELNTIAAGLRQLEDAGVVVLLRPFHEMNGGWFWWGGKDVTQFIAMWRHMFNYFTNVKHLDNLLWVYGPNDGTNCLKYYPGNEYVDMTGVDEYGDGVYLDGYDDLLTTGKPFGLTEFGPYGSSWPPDDYDYDYARLIQRIKASYPMTTFFQCWRGPWGIENNLNGSGLLNDSWIVNREDLPDFGTTTPDTTPPSVPGAVRDGTSASSDIDSTYSTSELSANWNASTDSQSPVSYKYAIGITAGGTNTAGWTNNSGTSVTRTGLTLAVGTRYYFSVKAVSSGGESAAANSDGALVEESNNLAIGKPVTVSSTESGSNVAANAVDGNTGTRWSSAYSNPQWIYVDLGQSYNINRVVLNWEAAYGTAYQIQVSANAVDWTQAYTTTSGNGGIDDISFSAVSARYVRMYGAQRATAYGYSLYEFEVYGSAVAADTTPPSAPGTVRDGATAGIDISSTTSRAQLSDNWTAAADAESGISGYSYAIGTSAGATNITNWTSLGNVLTATKTGLNLTVGTTYYFSVKAINGAGLTGSAANSNGQVVLSTAAPDTTPPSAPGAVRDGATAGTDASFTYSTTTLSVNWTASTDNESGITNYQYAIGTSQGATNITNGWISNGTNLTVTKTGLMLTVGTTYYFSVKAVNGVSLQSVAVNSNGQYVAAVNTADTTPPSIVAQVRDGNEIGTDTDVTYLTDELSANWDNSADSESGIFRYYYAIGSLPGATDITGWKDNGALTEVTEAGLALMAGTTYYFSVKAENGVSLQSNSTNSNGQLVLSMDSQSPVVSNVSAQGITSSWATITWETDETSTSRIEYGLTASYGSLTGEYLSMDTAHSVTIAGLQPQVQYHYRVISRDGSGNESISGDYTFTTLSTPTEVTEVNAYPNPCDFKNGQVMKFKVSAPGGPALGWQSETKIFTMSGKLIRTLTGTIEINWDGTNENGEKVSRGIYLYTITQGSDKITGKLAVSK